MLPPEIHSHQCILYSLSITHQLPTGQTVAAPRDSIISSSVLARPAACQPATGLVMSWSLSCPVLPPRVALGPVRPRTESHLAQVSLLRADDTSTCTVQYGTVLSVRVVPVLCVCMPYSPAQPSPAHFVFCLCMFLIMLHLPSFASWHLITEATTRASVLHSPLCPGEDPCFSAPSPSGGAVVPPSLPPCAQHIYLPRLLDCPLGRQFGTMYGVRRLHIYSVYKRAVYRPHLGLPAWQLGTLILCRVRRA